MDKASSEARWLTAVFGFLALILPAWMVIHVRLSDKRKSLVEARDEVLEPLKLDPPDTAPALKWLLPRWSHSRVYERQNTDKKLNAWLDSSKPVMIIDGGPLVGKTRTAIEWAGSLGPEWEAGWLRHDKATEAVKRVAAYGKNTVIVVDGVLPHLPELVHDLSQHKAPPQIRVLLTLRNFQGLRLDNPYAAAVIAGVKPLRLGPKGGPADREAWFDELCRHYAGKLGVPVPSKRPGFVRSLGAVPIGVLHAAALAAARVGAVPSGTGGIEELLYELWESEVNSWRSTPGVPSSGRDGVSDAQLERLEHVVVALSLLEPGSLQEAVGVLEKVPALSGTEEGTLKDIAAWAARMYPPASSSCHTVMEFSPRILVVAAFLHAASNDPNYGQVLLDHLTDSVAYAALGCLVEAAPLLPSAAAWATVLIDSNFQRLTTALEITLAGAPNNSAMDRELARCVGGFDLGEDETTSLQERIIEGSLPMVTVTLGELKVKQLQTRVGQNAGKYEPNLAGALINLAASYHFVGGRTADALTTAQEAVTIYKRLATDNPALHEPNFARALTNLANCLADSGGRDDEALASNQKAVTINQRLAADNPALYEPDLAKGLSNLANRLAHIGGRSNEALTTAHEAVKIYQRLAADNPALHEPDLARTLTNLASYYFAGGRPADSLEPAQEAVTIYQRLVADDLALHEPNLATALSHLAASYHLTGGRTADALTTAQEAVTIYQRLALDNPALHEPNLAGSLMNLVACLAEAGGRSAEALTTAQKGVAIYQRLAADNPALHQPKLAGALMNLAGCLAAAARTADALEPAQEAVTIYQRLATDNPALHEPNLALALMNLAGRLADAARTADALEPAQEAVTIYQRLATDNPALHEPSLARALDNLAGCLAENGMNAESIKSYEELLPTYERLARQDPRFDAPLARVQRIIWEENPRL